MIHKRLQNARLWVIIASSYYMLKAVLIVYPTYADRNESTKVVIIINSLI